MITKTGMILPDTPSQISPSYNSDHVNTTKYNINTSNSISMVSTAQIRCPS